ncbi:penicillin-binding protein 2 [Paenibacillus chitinolyticus]|uniref:peptidoglycan D,D-transpeptidase FtsI family protein n=1 Tax=Paenibacillus chitinolyticus TaxID=79263 RepID=UPI0026E4CBE8|nr:penicillin-binding transpeptidase domain-containing protein [Paenibacillus chitinolyticus]GKS10844.1 penicillin-binding protein 2 [Paenibacillus chitinolyticus]
MKSPYTEQDPAKREADKRIHFTLRINIFFFATFALFCVLIVKLSYLQFVKGPELQVAKANGMNTDTAIPPIRGNILSRDGMPIATSNSTESLYFRVEGGTKNQDPIIETAKKLEKILGELGDKNLPKMTTEDIMKAMDLDFDINKQKIKPKTPYSEPRRIKANLNKEEVAYLLSHRDELHGVEVVEESIRVYDQRKIAAQLVGYLKKYDDTANLNFYKSRTEDGYLLRETVGFDGLEMMYQDELRGKPGKKSYPVNAAGKIVGNGTLEKPEKGKNLRLTIDTNVQLAAQQAIMDQLKWLHSPPSGYAKFAAPYARSGYAVAMEVDTGKVVAMASMPDYDTNLWTGGMSTETYKQLEYFINNGTIRTSPANFPEKEQKKHPSSLVYLGSTIKPLSVLVGLQEGFLSPGSTYNDTGSFSFGKDKSTIRNSDGHSYGIMGPTKAIEVSSNTYMSAMIGIPFYNKYQKKSGELWDKHMAEFGLGVLTGSGLPREIEGFSEIDAAAKTSSYQSAMVYASWGQNEKYTTLQLTQFAATLGSRGKRMKPQFVEEILDSDGKVVKGYEPEILNQVDLPKVYWDTVINGMKSGAEGIDKLPYPVARKTGTSTQQVSGGTVDNAVFISFAPAQNPKLAVAVVVPEGGYGRYGASPIAAKIYEAYDQYVGGLSTPKK